MVQCSKCKQEGLQWHYLELKERNVLFTNSGVPHVCSANPFDVQKTVDDFSNNFHMKYKFKIPIWCNICDCSYRPDTVCSHIVLKGYQEGKDNITFFGDSLEARENRQKRKLQMKEEKIDPSIRTENNLTSFYSKEQD